MLSIFKKKVKQIITEQDILELKNLEREAYMNSARELVKIRGQERAKTELGIKQKEQF